MTTRRTIPIATELESQIYARSVKGWFNNWRWVMVWFTQLLFYGLPWLSWDGQQAVLFDLVNRRFHIVGVTFTPHDLIFLTLLLAISALSLFLFTAVAGRLWCGYTCPQTVYTKIFSWIELRIEGDRTQRMRRDRGPRNFDWLWHKAAKHGVWLALGLWTGFTFVGYFTPIRELGHQILTLQIGPWATFWVLFYGLATYGNAGWLREQVCIYMCPYARFQGVMFDRDTVTITYDPQRGEPRGSRSRQADPKALGLGDCIDCTLCVQVCPTGIDIRDGLQYECIGCAACIDVCNGVMDRMGYERGLIRYGTQSGLSPRYTGMRLLRRVFRPRVLVYTAILWTLIAIFVAGLWSHVPLRLEALRDRTVIMRNTDDGGVENLYQLHLINTANQPVTLRLQASGLPQLYLPETEREVQLPAQGSTTVVVHARLPAEHTVAPGTHAITFSASRSDDPSLTARTESSFILRR